MIHVTGKAVILSFGNGWDGGLFLTVQSINKKQGTGYQHQVYGKKGVKPK